MRKLILILVLASVTACTSPYGNYTKISEGYNKQMADDAASELGNLYPPASTHLVLSQDTQDAFGTELLKELRESGFAIEQSKGIGDIFAFSDNTQKAETKIDPSDPNYEPPPAKPSHTVAAKKLGYIVDDISDNLFRVTINVDDKVLNRVYMGSTKGIAPAGSWTRKE